MALAKSGSCIGKATNKNEIGPSKKIIVNNLCFLFQKQYCCVNTKHALSNGKEGFWISHVNEFCKNIWFPSAGATLSGQPPATMVISQARAWTGKRINRNRDYFQLYLVIQPYVLCRMNAHEHRVMSRMEPAKEWRRQRPREGNQSEI